MAELTIIDTAGAITRVALTGRLDTEGVDHLEMQFNTAICPSGKPAILDFSGVTFMSSMGIRMLVSAAKTLSRRGAKMAILSPQNLVRESIISAALDQLIPVADSEADAIIAIS
jgi:anti-sigma B factor antagonist